MAAEARSPLTRLDRPWAVRREPGEVVSWFLRLFNRVLLMSFLGVLLGMLVRRLFFIDYRPPSSWFVGVVVALVAAFGLLTRSNSRGRDVGEVASAERWGLALRPAVLGLLAATVSVRGAPLLPLIILWGTVFLASRRELQAVEEQGAILLRRLADWRADRVAARNAGGTDDQSRAGDEVDGRAAGLAEAGKECPPVAPAPPLGTVPHADDHAGEAGEGERTLMEGTNQQWVRGTDESGVAYCSGRVRLPVAQGQRTISWHAVLYPAFERPPEIEVEVVGGLDAECQWTQVLRHGWRAELKLARVAQEDSEVVLEFYAWQPSEEEGEMDRQSDAA